jgi:hypothetical protein
MDVDALKMTFDKAETIIAPTPSNLTAQEPTFKIYSVKEILEFESRVQWVLYPYVEANATTLMSGERGTFKSFIALDWACRAALGTSAIGYSQSVGPKRVLFISAEGKGLSQRLAGWLRHQYPNGDASECLEILSTNLKLMENPINLCSAEIISRLCEQLDSMSHKPDFIIVDTLTRNSNGRIEESNAAAQQYLCELDASIRARYSCAILLIHHVGKDQGRGARGPSSLADNTEAEIIVSRPDPGQQSALVSFGRVKDSEPPRPFRLDTLVVDTGKRDGFDQPVNTLVMVSALEDFKSPAGRPPQGKNQRELLSVLKANHAAHPEKIYPNHELRQILKGLEIDRQRHSETIKGLVTRGYLAPTGNDQYTFNAEGRSSELP